MNIVYLVLFVIGSGGITSQAIPQANMAQCQINAKQFNTENNKYGKVFIRLLMINIKYPFNTHNIIKYYRNRK